MDIARQDLPDGPAWSWRTWPGVGDVAVTHELQWVEGRQVWLRRERFGYGGWVAREADELPLPKDQQQAERIVSDLVQAETEQ